MSAVNTIYTILSSSNSSTFSQSSSTGSISVSSSSTAVSLLFESTIASGAPAPSVGSVSPPPLAPSIAQLTQVPPALAPLSSAERMRYVYRNKSPAHAGELLRLECMIPMDESLLKATSGSLDKVLLQKIPSVQKVWDSLQQLLNTHLQQIPVQFEPHSVATANNHLYFGMTVVNQTKAVWTEARSLTILKLLEILGCSKCTAAKDQCHVYLAPMPLTNNEKSID